MKKLLSFLLAMCLMLSTSITVFASESKTDTVQNQINGAAQYITKNVDSYGVANSVEYCELIESTADVSKYEDGFIQDVKNNLEENNGKLMVDVFDYSTYTSTKQEALYAYAGVILALLYLGEDPADFNGVNLMEQFVSMDTSVAESQVYYYSAIIKTASLCFEYDEDQSFINSIIDTYIAEYYTMGKGVNYYGYSCDNTANFIIALANYGYDYEEYLIDAVNVLNTYKVDDGFCHNPEFGTTANCDSTALALSAYCSACLYIDDITTEDLDELYTKLCAFESDETGVFNYEGEKNIFATKDALIALTAYYPFTFFYSYDETEETTTKSNNTSDKSEKSVSTTANAGKINKENNGKKSPATGANTGIIAISSAIAGAGIVIFAIKKKKV